MGHPLQASLISFEARAHHTAEWLRLESVVAPFGILKATTGYMPLKTTWGLVDILTDVFGWASDFEGRAI
jgi:hypothetical protein